MILKQHQPISALLMRYSPDDRSRANIGTLEPKVQAMAEAFLAAANEALEPLGIVVKIISGSRTYAEQDALYAKGRTEAGQRVTNARGGYSNHNFGIAFDIGLFQAGKYLSESEQYAKLAPIGKKIGLAWGGDWKSIVDEPHYEYPTGLHLDQMRELHAAGKSVIA